MNITELIATYRRDADDKASPPIFTDEEITLWLHEAEREAAIRARLIKETDNRAMCVIKVQPGKTVYPLHKAMYELTHVALRSAGCTKRAKLDQVSTVYLDDKVHDWRDAQGTPKYVVQEDKTLRVVPAPLVEAEILLEGYRLPVNCPCKDDEPEINAAHHVHLVKWVLHKAFAVPDADFMDAQRSDKALFAFEEYFGRRPDADLRRITQEDVPHHVQPSWP